MAENKSDLHDLTEERRQILIVEDETVNKELLKLVLKDDYDLIFVETGEEATDIIKEKNGDLSLILLDPNLPDMNGIDILKDMQGDDMLRAIPVMVPTANAFDEDDKLSLQVGMNAHLSKPVNPEELYQTLESII